MKKRKEKMLLCETQYFFCNTTYNICVCMCAYVCACECMSLVREMAVKIMKNENDVSKAILMAI